ncbi:MAG: hypothetical protein R2712_00670 [Vicinamibacterales bacterium]
MATRASSWFLHPRRVARPHHDLQRLPRAEEFLERAEGDHHELVQRVAEGGALLRRHAHDAKRHAGYPHLLVDGVRGAEEPVRHLPARERHVALATDLDGADHPSALGVETS